MTEVEMKSLVLSVAQLFPVIGLAISRVKILA